MANLIEFLVKVKDLASGPMTKIAGTGEKSFGKLGQQVNSFSSKFSRLGMSINDIDKKLDHLQKTRRMTVDSSQLKSINREIDQLERRKSRLEGSGPQGGGFGLGGLVGGAMAMAGVAGLGGMVGMGMEKQMTNKRFEVMAGKAQGGKLSGDLTQFAQSTMYGNEVFGAAQTMLSFGVNAKAVMPSLQKLGDIAGGDKDKLQSLSLAFSQVAATGRLTGQDLLQFVNAGFNPLQEMSAKTGKSMGTLKKEMEDGKVSFLDVATSIESATGKGGRFFEMTKQIGDSAPGKLLALQGAAQGMASNFGSDMLNLMVPLMDFTQWLIDTPGMVNGLATAIGALAVGIGIYNVVTKWATVSAWLMNIALMWPVVLFAAIVGGIALLVTRYQGWGDAMKALWTVIKAWVSNVGIAFKDFFQDVGFKLERFVLKVKENFQFIGGTIQNFITAMKLASQMDFAGARKALGAKVTTTATAEIEALEKKRTAQRKENLADFAANMATIQNTGILNKLKLREGNGKKGAPATPGAGGFLGTFTGMGGGGTGAPSSVEGAASGITGGGIRTMNVTVHKFFDKIEVHSNSVSEGMAEIEDKILEVMLRVTNSAAQSSG
ncbi:tape measure protein [Rufibacter immobilis]|uniref:tape measure protein n=1 Tax=Rufibacter immobilis TaxID=1348778 RepID=UPI0035EDDEF8